MATIQPPLVVDDPRLDMFARKHYITVGVMMPLATIALLLRFWTRRQRLASLSWDDAFAVLAWIFCMAIFIIFLDGFKNGVVGFPRPKLPKKNGKHALMLTYAAPVLNSVEMTAAKFSVLALYRRVFNPIRSFQIQLWVVAGLCSAWFIAAFFSAIFRCSPVSGGWDPAVLARPTTHCSDFQKWAASTEIASGILDFAVAGIAIGSLRHLQMNIAQKIGLGLLFILTAFVAVIGAIRVSLTYNLNTGGRFAPDEGIFWSTIQLGLAVICCCLPTYGSMLTAFNRSVKKLRTRVAESYGSRSSKLSSSRSGTRSGNRSGNRSGITRVVNPDEYELDSPHSDGIPFAAPYYKMDSAQSGELSRSNKADV